MNQLTYFLAFVLLAPLLFSFWVEGLNFLASVLSSSALRWFEFGLIPSMLLQAILGGPVVGFLETAVHELTHSFVGLLFSRRTDLVMAISTGDGVTQFDIKPNLFVSLAPYYFPLLAIPFLVAEPLVGRLGNTAKSAVDLLLGVTMGFHYVLHIKQFRFSQKDLTSTGIIVSIGLTYTLMLIFLVVTVAVVLGSYSSILSFLANSFVHTPDYYRIVVSWLHTLRSRL